MDVHALGRVSDVEVEINVDVEFTRKLKNPSKLPGVIGIVSRRATEDRRAALERFDQKFISTGIIGEAFLREYADLDIYRPLELFGERLHALKPAQADSGINLNLR